MKRILNFLFTVLLCAGTSMAQNNAAELFDLGEKYYYGRGVEQSYTEAEKYYRQAAEQGYAKAQNNLKRLGETW